MPTFRFKRLSYEDSMKTCVVVNCKQELINKIIEFNLLTGLPRKEEDELCSSYTIYDEKLLTIKPYIFDSRNGWETHLVIVKNQCVTQDPWIIGFLSDNFKE